MTALNGLLVGVGHMGQLHRTKLLERSDVRLRVHDPELGFVAKVDSSTDFVIISSPTASHRQLIPEYLGFDIPVLVEKPLVAEGDLDVDWAQDKNLCVGHIERFNPAILALPSLTPRLISSERLCRRPRHGGRIRTSGGDVVMDLMIHDLDLCLSFFGSEIMETVATGASVISDQIDVAHGNLVFGNGVGELTASRVADRNARSMHIFEDTCCWVVDMLGGTLKRAKVTEDGQLGEMVDVEVSKTDALMEEHSAFFRHIQGVEPFPIGGVAAMNAVSAAGGIQKAIQLTYD